MAMWQDIAAALRDAITRGDYPPGTTIPKETELMAAHGAGRETVRRAVIQLTAEGLVEPVRRRGTVVRVRPARRPVTRSRLVYRDELGYYFDQAAQGWRPLQPPSVSRGPVPFDVAAQLGVAPGDEAVIRDRIMGDPQTGQPTQLATSYIPAGLATELPVLAARDTGPGGIYDRMEEAGSRPDPVDRGHNHPPPITHRSQPARTGPGRGTTADRAPGQQSGRPAAGSQRHAHERRRVRDQLPSQPRCLCIAANASNGVIDLSSISRGPS